MIFYVGPEYVDRRGMSHGKRGHVNVERAFRPKSLVKPPLGWTGWWPTRYKPIARAWNGSSRDLAMQEDVLRNKVAPRPQYHIRHVAPADRYHLTPGFGAAGLRRAEVAAPAAERPVVFGFLPKRFHIVVEIRL